MTTASIIVPSFCLGAVAGMWWMRHCYRSAINKWVKDQGK